MLRPSDADLVRRDRDLPDLALMLDSDRLNARLEQTLGHGRISGVAVNYLRYKPGQSCLAACQAEVNGQQIDFIVKAYRPSAIDKFLKAAARTDVPGPLGCGRFVLDDSTLIVSVFPNDGRLTRLGRLTSPDSMAQLAARLGVPPEATTRLETLRHNPERRFVGRLVADGNSIATVRCYTPQDYARIATKADALKSFGPLRLAKRLTRRNRWHLLTFEWLHGSLLEDAIRQRTVSPSAMRVVGMALACLHAQEAPALPRRTGASEAAALDAMARQVGFLHPRIAVSASNLARHAGARLMAETGSHRPLHGDFYAKQVLLAGDTAALIDLDEASLGDPATDLARFCADLEETVVSGRLDAREVEPLKEPLLDGYRATSGGLPPHLNLHIAAQLLRVAAHPFRRREPSWREMTAAILERAETFLQRDGAESPKSVRTERGCRSLRVVDPFGVANDPLMPFLTQALNPGHMALRFARDLNCLDAAAETRVVGISVMRHKRGRRCLIGYDLAAHDASGTVRALALVGKARARSTDTSTHELLQTLWTGSFGACADDCILVPEPLGMIRDMHMGVQRRVSGKPLTHLLDGASGLQLARRAAEAIDKLHRVSAPVHRRHTVDDELWILREGLMNVAQAHLQWHARIVRLFEGCVRLAARVAHGPRCGIHRDFYPEQLLIDGERTYLMDFDLYSQGDPALDLGNFVAHLEEYSLRRFGDEDHLADRSGMLIERFLQLSGKSTYEAIHVWTTLSLARHIAISRLFAERQPFTAALLDLCESRVFGGSANDRVVGLARGREKGATQ